MPEFDYSKLTLMNDFLFSTVMHKKEFCIPMLELILSVKIKDLKYHSTQETVIADIPESKSVRLDVYAEDDNDTVYDIEVQTSSNGNLPRRTRMYQSMIDARALQEGEDYRKLNRSYVIFICNFDPFRKDRYMYSFRTRCEEDDDIYLDDGAYRIILNVNGSVGEISDGLKEFVRYMATGRTTGDYTKKLDNEVDLVRNDRKWRHEYMTLAQKFIECEDVGMHKLWVRLVRKKIDQLDIYEMQEMFDIPSDDCQEIIDVIKAHPDWTDEKVAETIQWEDWK